MLTGLVFESSDKYLLYSVKFFIWYKHSNALALEATPNLYKYGIAFLNCPLSCKAAPKVMCPLGKFGLSSTTFLKL